MNDKKLKMMREERMPSVLLKLGLPTMIGMLINALYSVVDAYFVGGLGTSQMGAVSVVFPISQVIVGLGMTFGSGAASYISRLLGANQETKANQTASTALFSSIVVGIVSIAISLCFLTPLLSALGATETIMPYARGYAIIFISGSILNIFNVTMNNIVTAEGAAKLTMAAMLTGAGLNAVLDPIFIYPLKMGIEGAAVASVLAHAITSIIYIWYLLRKKGFLRISLRQFTFDKTIYMEIFKVGIPTLIFQLLASVSIALTNTAASVYGDTAVAAMGIVTRIMTLGTYVIYGYMKGFQPVAGYSFGAKLYDRLQEAIRVSLKWSTVFCCLMALLSVSFAPQIISAFSQGDASVVEIGSNALRANAILFSCFGYVAIYMSLFLALGKGKEGSLLSTSRQGIFFVPAILIMPLLFGVNGIIYAQPVADVFTIILTVVLSLRLNRSLKELQRYPTT